MKQAIIGVLVAAIAGVLVLAVDYSFFKSSTDRPIIQAKEETQNPLLLAVQLPHANGDQNNQPPEKLIYEEDNKPDESLVNLYQTAKKISNSFTKATELRKLSDYAASKGYISYATLIAKDIPDSFSRGVALSDIVEKALKLKQFELATEAAQSIPNSFSRDQNLRRVLEAIQKEK